MKILGTGIDIVETVRIADSVEKSGDAFLRRIFTPEELDYCLGHASATPHLAARFAAKEAVAKAFGTGIGAQLGWRDMSIRRQENGQPTVVFSGKALELVRQRGVQECLISLTHSRDYAAAHAILIGE
ncbi:MAG: holo-ACP synthase [Verrucomicrobiae bacterium]|nr:holo-ACP synthase [Verrucomicrobiae bacterium]